MTILYLDVVLQELTSQRVKNGKIRPGIKSGLSDVLDTTVREKNRGLPARSLKFHSSTPMATLS